MAPQASSASSRHAAADAASRTADAAASILARSKSEASASALPAPDLLLRHLDRAIASAEQAHASLLLSPPSPSLYASHLHSPSALSPAFGKHKEESHPRVVSGSGYSAQHVNTKFAEGFEAEGAVRAGSDTAPLHGNRLTRVSYASDDSALEKTRDASIAGAANGQYDARLADEAYRAGNASLSEGNIQKSLKLLQLALSKCPPDRPTALAKIRRLITVAMQQLQKKQTIKTQAAP